MKKYLIAIVLIVGCISQSWSQELLEETRKEKRPLVNITEFGYMFGRIKAPMYGGGWFAATTDGSEPKNYRIQNIKNLTFNMFNGVYIRPETAVGISIGLDSYDATLVIPFQIGVRQTLIKKEIGGNKIYAAFDIGYGSTSLHEDDDRYKTKGGLTFNPAVGYKIKMRNTSSLVLSFGYKYQHLSLTQTTEDGNANYYSNYLETRKHNRLIIRLGFEF